MQQQFYIKPTSFLVSVIFIILLFASQVSGEHRDHRRGNLTIKNETEKTMYIVIDEYNQGEIWSNYSKVYNLRLGEHKIEACYDDKVIRKYIILTESYPDETWCISTSQL